MWRESIFCVTFLTLYKDAFPGYLGESVIGRGLRDGRWSIKVIDIRDFAIDKHRSVDGKVYGGGKGLLLKADVLGRAIDYAFANGASRNLIYASAQGGKHNQENAWNLSKLEGLTFICGHFEGIDQRIIDKYKPREISIGDYILSGGEISSMVIADSVLRLLPNMVNSQECIMEESFKGNLLEYPQYTSPRSLDGMDVPEVLLSGNHKKVEQWRREKSIEKTRAIRPDLLNKDQDHKC